MTDRQLYLFFYRLREGALFSFLLLGHFPRGFYFFDYVFFDFGGPRDSVRFRFLALSFNCDTARLVKSFVVVGSVSDAVSDVMSGKRFADFLALDLTP